MDNDCLSDKDEDIVMETVALEALAIKPAKLLSFRTVNVESDLSLNGESSFITPSTLTVIKPLLKEPLSMPNVCTNDVDKTISLDKVSPAEKSIYTFILAMKLDKQEQFQKFCQTVNAKCTTSVMLYEQKQPPLKVRAPAVLLFRSINADMMAKINDLPVTHVATDVKKNSPLYKAL